MRTSRLLQTIELALPEIWALGKKRAPVEACGLLLDTPRRVGNTSSYIIELPNRSLEAGAYLIAPADLQMTLESVGDAEEVAIWHTHPSGLAGPSAGDLRHRPPDVPMVVVALTEDGPLPVWF